MPLPPAPTKRAALLPPQAYDAPARSSHKASRKSEAVQTDSPLPERPQALDFDPRRVARVPRTFVNCLRPALPTIDAIRARLQGFEGLFVAGNDAEAVHRDVHQSSSPFAVSHSLLNLER